MRKNFKKEADKKKELQETKKPEDKKQQPEKPAHPVTPEITNPANPIFWTLFG